MGDEDVPKEQPGGSGSASADGKQIADLIAEQKKREEQEVIRENLRIAAGQVETCDGSSQDGIRKWFEDVEMGMQYVGKENTVRLCRRTVTGSFRRELEKFLISTNAAHPNKVPWEEVKKHLTTSFLSTDEAGHARAKLERITQAEKEETQAFNRRFRTMADIAYPPKSDQKRSTETEEILVRLYARSLRSEHFAKKVVNAEHKKPEDNTLETAMQSVVKLACAQDKYDMLGRPSSSREVSAVSSSGSVDVESDLSSINRRVNKVENSLADVKGRTRLAREANAVEKKGDFSKKPRDKGKQGKFRKKFNGQKQKLPRYDENGRPRCFNCNKYGHIAKDCSAPKDQKPATASVNYAAGTEWS